MAKHIGYTVPAMSLLALDQNLTESLYGLTRDNPGLQNLCYYVATYLMYLLPIMLIVLFWRRATRIECAKIFVMTLFTWEGMNRLIGNFFYNNYAFRDRPFASYGYAELLFEQPQKAFPSDHAAVFLFVTLTLFYYRQKTWAWVFLAATILGSIARVMVGFHWAGDIVGGWLIGALGFALLVALDKPLQAIGEWFFGFFDRMGKNEGI